MSLGDYQKIPLDTGVFALLPYQEGSNTFVECPRCKGNAFKSTDDENIVTCEGCDTSITFKG